MGEISRLSGQFSELIIWFTSGDPISISKYFNYLLWNVHIFISTIKEAIQKIKSIEPETVIVSKLSTRGQWVHIL